MNRLFLLLIGLLLFIPAPRDAWAGALPWEVPKSLIRIWGVSCDASLPKEHPESCFNRKISLDKFEVKTQGYGGPTTLKLGEHKYTFGMGPKFRQEGDLGCVYFKMLGDFRMNRSADGVVVTSDTSNTPTMIQIEDGAMIEHCFPLPRPDLFDPVPKKKALSKYISPVCTLGCDIDPATGKPACATHAAYIGDKQYLRFFTPFLAPAAQCMYETVYLMFDPDLKNGVFYRVMDGFRSIVLSALALYFTLQGLQYASLMKGNKQGEIIEQFDFIWIFVKAILVAFFTSPAQQGETMSVGFLYKSVMQIQSGLVDYILTVDDADFTFSKLKNETNLEKALNLGKVEEKKKTGDLSKPETLTLKEFSYDYCNFTSKNFNYGNYELKGAEGNSIDINKAMYRIWDMMDCRFLSYLGFGYFDYNRDKGGKNDANAHTFPKAQAPSILIYALIFIFAYVGLGIVATVFMLAFTIFCGMLFMKFFMGFVSSIMIMSVLFIISPIAFTLVLFPLTSRIFTQWVTEVLNVMVQPAIYAVFMIIFLMFTDRIFYGENRTFNGFGNTKTEALIVGGITVDNKPLADPNKITLVSVGGGRYECKDPSTMACVLGYGIKTKRIMSWLGPLGFSLYTISMSSFKSVYGALLWECLKLFADIVVFFFIGQIIEQLIQQLAISTGGAFGLARMATPNNPVSYAVGALRGAATWISMGPRLAIAGSKMTLGAAKRGKAALTAGRPGANTKDPAAAVSAGGTAGKTARPQTRTEATANRPKFATKQQQAGPASSVKGRGSSGGSEGSAESSPAPAAAETASESIPVTARPESKPDAKPKSGPEPKRAEERQERRKSDTSKYEAPGEEKGQRSASREAKTGGLRYSDSAKNSTNTDSEG